MGDNIPLGSLEQDNYKLERIPHGLTTQITPQGGTPGYITPDSKIPVTYVSLTHEPKDEEKRFQLTDSEKDIIQTNYAGVEPFKGRGFLTGASVVTSAAVLDKNQIETMVFYNVESECGEKIGVEIINGRYLPGGAQIRASELDEALANHLKHEQNVLEILEAFKKTAEDMFTDDMDSWANAFYGAR